MKTLLITGGAGFIGSNLATALLKKGNYDIHIVDIKDNPANLEDIRDKVNYLKGDIRDKKFLINVFNSFEFDGVIHLAAVSRVIWCEKNLGDCFSINISGTRNLLNTISNLQDKPWIIFSSSREVYGNQNIFPVKEEFNRDPVGIYGKTKYICEDIIKKYTNRIDLKAIILRLSNIYGNERDIPERVIPTFIMRTLQGKEIIIYGKDKFFDFTFIYDAILGIVKALEKMDNMYNKMMDIYNISTGKPTTLGELAETVSNIVGISVDIKYMKPQPYEVRHFYGDNTKARKYLGWYPQWNIEDGLKHTINRYKRLLEVI